MLRSSYTAVVLLYFQCCIWPSLETPPGVLCPPLDGVRAGCACKSDQGVIDLRPLASIGAPRLAVMNQWTVPLEWNGGMECWNDPYSPCYFFPEAVLGALSLSGFTGLSDPNNFQYDFNPCYTFSSEGECSDVYVCQTTSLDNSKYAIANQGDEGIYIDGDTTYLYYTGPGGRETLVELKCDKSNTDPYVTTVGDSEIYLVYKFVLTSKYVCPGRGGGGGKKTNITLSWTPPTGQITGYLVNYYGFKEEMAHRVVKDGPYSIPVPTDQTTIQIDNLQLGLSYSFTVGARIDHNEVTVIIPEFTVDIPDDGAALSGFAIIFLGICWVLVLVIIVLVVIMVLMVAAYFWQRKHKHGSPNTLVEGYSSMEEEEEDDDANETTRIKLK